MRSIYNENLVPNNHLFHLIGDKFREQVVDLFKTAAELDLNFREVSHEFSSILQNVESDFVIARAMGLNK